MHRVVGACRPALTVSALCTIGPSSALLSQQARHVAVAAAPSRPTGSSISSSLSPSARRDRARKAERKRERRSERSTSLAAAEAIHNELYRREQRETVEKRRQAEQLTANLHPVTAELLESIYHGLMQAAPEELALPQPEEEKRPRLQLPTNALSDERDDEGRPARVALLNERLRNVLAPSLSQEQVEQDDDPVKAVERLQAIVEWQPSPSNSLVSRAVLPQQDWSDIACSLVRLPVHCNDLNSRED